jgi:uncharacterized protein
MADNVGTVHAIYEAFGRGDVAWILEQLDDEVAWDPTVRDTGLPYLQPGHGKAAVAEFFTRLAQSVEITHFEPQALCDGGAVVAVPLLVGGQMLGGGAIATQQEVHLWTFNDAGRVVRFEHVYDLALHEASAAVRSEANTGAVFDVAAERLEVLRGGGQFEVFALEGLVDVGPPPHAHPWDEAYYGLSGTMELVVGDERRVLSAGGFAVVPGGTLHTFRLLSADAKFLVVTGGHRASMFFADVAANVAPGIPNDATLPALVEAAKRKAVASPLFTAVGE